MAASNPSAKQARNQRPVPTGRHAEDYRHIKTWHQAEAEAAARAPGEHRTPTKSRPGG